MEPMTHLALVATLLHRAHSRALNCSIISPNITNNGTNVTDGVISASGVIAAELVNGTWVNGTCPDVGVGDDGNDLGMVKVGVLTAVLVVVMISTCRLLFKMYAQFGMRDSPDGTDKAFGE